jgi:hypothetical protein
MYNEISEMYNEISEQQASKNFSPLTQFSFNYYKLSEKMLVFVRSSL